MSRKRLGNKLKRGVDVPQRVARHLVAVEDLLADRVGAPRHRRLPGAVQTTHLREPQNNAVGANRMGMGMGMRMGMGMGVSCHHR